MRPRPGAPHIALLVALSLALGLLPAGSFLSSASAAQTREDQPYALDELQEMARKGDPRAQRMLAEIYESGTGVLQDYAEAFRWYLAAAANNDAPSQFMVAQMYYQGKGGPQDPARAVHWYRKAADQGHTYALYNLGIFHEQGLGGIRANKAEAFKWYLRAAELGLAEAQHKVGTLYAAGSGVPQDNMRAYCWLEVSAARGSQEAARERDALAQHMTPDQVARARELASKMVVKPGRSK